MTVFLYDEVVAKKGAFQMKGIYSVIGKTIVGVLMIFAIILVLSLLDQVLLKEANFGNFISPIGLGLTAGLMVVLFERKNKFDIGWKDRFAVQHVFTGIVMSMIVMTVTMFFMLMTGKVALQEQFFGWNIILFHVFLFLMVATGEEWLFRGYFFGLYQTKIGNKTAIFLNSILFTTIHLFNPESFSRPIEHMLIEMTNIFLISLFLSMTRLFSGSLWMPIAIHFSINFLQSAIFGFANGGKEVESVFHLIYEELTLWNGSGYGLESTFIFAPILVLANVMLFVLYRRKRNKV
ncbi:CPBP family intramembrane metalloprotease [Lysinibacillus sp. BW-2-10]|nr:CPBP family intramembrane metalloprotease [Lysinibacillus sp. BW-2-10]